MQREEVAHEFTGLVSNLFYPGNHFREKEEKTTIKENLYNDNHGSRGVPLQKQSNWLIYIKLLGTVFFWGGAFVAAKIAVQEFTPLVAATLRFIMAFMVLAPVLAWREGRGALVKIRDWPLLIAAAFTGIILYHLFFFQGLRLTSPIEGSLIVAACPAVTVAFSWLF